MTGGCLTRLLIIGRVFASPAFNSADFRRLWIAVGFNSTGYSGEHMIFGLLVFQITGSTAWVGVSMAIYALPSLVFGILSDVLTD